MSRDWTIQENYKRLNKVLVFIEQNINEKLTLNQLADIACLSPYHFHRIFTALIGESLYDYIKRLRLEGAAFKIRYSNESIGKISTTFGYNRLTSFSKAFKRHFGQTPRDFRDHNKLSDCELENAMDINVRYHKLPDTNVIFIRETGEYQKAARKAWQALIPIAYQHQLIADSTKAIGISYDSPAITDAPNIRYDACIDIETSAQLPGVVGKQTIAGGNYAVFRHIGPYETMESTFKTIYEQWLPHTDKQLRDAPSFCHFHQIDAYNLPADELITDIYIPLKS